MKRTAGFLIMLSLAAFCSCKKSQSNDDSAPSEIASTDQSLITSPSNVSSDVRQNRGPLESKHAGSLSTHAKHASQLIRSKGGDVLPIFKSISWDDDVRSLNDPSSFLCKPTTATNVTSMNGAEVHFECELVALEERPYPGDWSLVNFVAVRKNSATESIDTDEMPGTACFSFNYPRKFVAEINHLLLTFEIRGEAWTVAAVPVL